VCNLPPYWVRAQDRKRRIADTLAAGGTLSAEDRAWHTKADKVGIRQVFMPFVAIGASAPFLHPTRACARRRDDREPRQN
jgi:hypothetical protein